MSAGGSFGPVGRDLKRTPALFHSLPRATAIACGMRRAAARLRSRRAAFEMIRASLNNEVPSEPVIFLKPNSSISERLRCDDNDGIHYEGELSFVMRAGKPYAVGFGLDLTKRAVQTELKAKGLPWERAKAFDGAAVFSPFTKLQDDTTTLSLELLINGRLTQKGGVELMLHKPGELINHIQRFISFEDNDIVMTGTPKGVGPVRPGDRFTGRVLDGESLLLEASWRAAI